MFERFTDRARRVLVLAQEHARVLDSAYIGTEHLVLALCSEEEGLAARALQARGVTEERLVAAIKAKPRTDGIPISDTPSFTPRAKKSMELALRESLAIGSNFIGTEHLLLGVIREGEGRGLAILADLGVDPNGLRSTVVEMLSPQARRRESTFTDPRCPNCRKPLAGRIRYRTVTVESADDSAAEPIRVTLLYCLGCGCVVSSQRDT